MASPRGGIVFTDVVEVSGPSLLSGSTSTLTARSLMRTVAILACCCGHLGRGDWEWRARECCCPFPTSTSSSDIGFFIPLSQPYQRRSLLRYQGPGFGTKHHVSSLHKHVLKYRGMLYPFRGPSLGLGPCMTRLLSPTTLPKVDASTPALTPPARCLTSTKEPANLVASLQLVPGTVEAPVSWRAQVLSLETRQPSGT
jgi:hypothetical protein